METVRKIADGYAKLEKWVLIAMMACLVIVIFAQVFTRYVMGQALYWSEELGKFVFVWMSWLGVSAGLKEKEHIQVKLFPGALHAKGCLKAEKLVYIIISIAWFITSLAVLWYGSEIVLNQMETGVYGASTQIPMWIAYLCIPVSALSVCLRLVFEAITDASDLIHLFQNKKMEGVS